MGWVSGETLWRYGGPEGLVGDVSSFPRVIVVLGGMLRGVRNHSGLGWDIVWE